eukprot:scaffold16121_cov20-Tisochrysis_lutea.AAC.6
MHCVVSERPKACPAAMHPQVTFANAPQKYLAPAHSRLHCSCRSLLSGPCKGEAHATGGCRCFTAMLAEERNNCREQEGWLRLRVGFTNLEVNNQ